MDLTFTFEPRDDGGLHGVQWAMPQCDDRAAWLKAAPVGREAV